MNLQKSVSDLLAALDQIAPTGYMAGMHIRLAYPLFYRSSYPKIWLKQYEDKSLYYLDPTVYWGSAWAGTIRWSQSPLPDPFGILKRAASFGLRFGAISSCGLITSRSIVGISRSDREFTNAELAQFTEITQKLHVEVKPPAELTPSQIEALKSIARGDRSAEASAKLGISESAFKARLKSARVRLKARTTTEAMRKAKEYRLM